MLSGIALMVFGAGLILSNPVAQRYLSRIGSSEPGAGSAPRPRAIFATAGDVKRRLTPWHHSSLRKGSLFRLPENMGISHDGRAGGGRPGAAAASGDRYVINPMVSRFTVKAFATGLLSAFGHSPTIADSRPAGRDAVRPCSHRAVFAAPGGSRRLVDGRRQHQRQRPPRDGEARCASRCSRPPGIPEIVYDAPRVSVKNTTDGQSDVVLLGTTRPCTALPGAQTGAGQSLS